MANILYSDYYLPENRIPTGKYFEMVDIPVPKIYSSKEEYCEAYIKQTKVEYVCIENKFSLVEIFSDMLTKMFENTGLDRNQIKYIFYTRSYQTYYDFYGDGKYYGKNIDDTGSDLPYYLNIPYYLAEKFQLKNTCVITSDGKCGSVTQAMDLGAMCCDMKKGYALVLTPSISRRANRYVNFTLMGDGAGIMLLSSNKEDGDLEIVDTFSRTNGKLSQRILNSSHNLSYLQEVLSFIDPLNAAYDSMFKSEVLDFHGIKDEDIKAVITLNINNIINRYNEAYPSKVYAGNLPYGGHISDVDLIRNLKDFILHLTPGSGGYILILTSGTDFTGLEYGGVLLRYRKGDTVLAV